MGKFMEFHDGEQVSMGIPVMQFEERMAAVTTLPGNPIADVYLEVITLRSEVAALTGQLQFLVDEERRRFMLPHRRFMRWLRNYWRGF